MRVDGEWHFRESGKIQPVIGGMVRTQDGSFKVVRFLVDTGADNTVFSAHIHEILALPPVQSHFRAEGVGGRAASEVVETEVQLTTTIGTKLTFKGQFLAFTNPAALDMSVLGRDITNLFTLIVDRPQEVVCLLGQGHRYAIAEG